MIRTAARRRLNRLLRVANMRLESLTAERQETGRLAALAADGHFDRPVFPVPAQFLELDAGPWLERALRCAERVSAFSEEGGSTTGFVLDNDWFRSPDAEMLYAFVQHFRPANVIEVGSGNSTRLFRQAILDGGLDTRLLSIDPQPRTDIESVPDELLLKRVEAVPQSVFAERLQPNDILFIDSSHEIRAGNDVLFLFLEILPALRPGVIIHVHDVFLPYDYPAEWLIDDPRGWTEQYLLQGMLSMSDSLEVLWPGYFLQRTVPEFDRYFPNSTGARAQSIWLRKR